MTGVIGDADQSREYMQMPGTKTAKAASKKTAKPQPKRAKGSKGVPKKAPRAAAPKPAPTAAPKKLGVLSAAAQVLSASDAPMTCQEMIEQMAKQGLWTSPNGKTPSQTLFAAITREIKAKGAESRFIKTERGKFEARKA